MRFQSDPDEAVLKRAEVQAGPAARAGRRLLAETVAECRAQEASLWLISQDGHQMEGTLNHGRTPEILEKSSVPVDDSVVGLVASSGLATSIGPGEAHNTSIDSQTRLPVTAMIVAPVVVGGKICGALSAINPTPDGQNPAPPVFAEDSFETLQWKAFLMGLVLSHAAMA